MSAPSLAARARGHFVAPRDAPAEPLAAPTRLAPRAIVLGTATDAPPVAAALANALRAAALPSRRRHATALVATWAHGTPRPEALGPPSLVPVGRGEPAEARPTSGPATPAAARLAARLTARGLPSAARGRLAWLRLADHPVAAGLAARRAAGALEVPVVVALAGPRVEALEGLLREQDLAVVVADDPDGTLARIAVATSPVPAIACAPLGPAARMLALAGLAGPRVLAEPVRAAVGPPADLAEEWTP